MLGAEIIVFIWVVGASLSPFLMIKWYYIAVILITSVIGSSITYSKALKGCPYTIGYGWSLSLAGVSLVAALAVMGVASISLMSISLFLLVRSILLIKHNGKKVNKASDSEKEISFLLDFAESGYKQITEELQRLKYEPSENDMQSVIESLIDRIGQIEKGTNNLDGIHKQLNQLNDNIRQLELRQSKSADMINLKNMMRDFVEKLQKERFDFSNSKTLHNAEVRKKLLEAFSKAENEINIVSPWVNRYAVDKDLMAGMERALKRNVNIKIAYGIDSGSNHSKDNRNNRSRQVVEELQHYFKKYDLYFKARSVNTHVKLLLCDDKFCMIGSYNLLSFKGDYGSDTREEIMHYSENPVYIKELRKRYFDF